MADDIQQEENTGAAIEKAVDGQKERAFACATAFCENLKAFIRKNEANITNTNKDYIERKLKLVGHSLPLILTYQYVNSIKVFTDTTGQERPEKTDEEPRFYVPVYGYPDCWGYYVDVEDVWHDPSPFTRGGFKLKGKFLRYRPEKLKPHEKGYLTKQRKLIEKQLQEYLKQKPPKNPYQLIRMRDLKRVLEYGIKNNSGNSIMHWAYFIEVMRPAYEAVFEDWPSLLEEIE